MAYSAPELKDLRSSPSLQELSQQQKDEIESTFVQFFKDKQVLNSVRWGFAIGSLITFNALYHTRGQFFRALGHGTVGALVVIPLKYFFLMRQQKMEFFRAVSYAAQTGDTSMTTHSQGRIVDREALYDPNEPYTEEEWAFARDTYRGVKIFGIAGAFGGLFGGIAVLHIFKFNQGKLRSPLWMRLLLVASCIGFGAVAAMKIRLNTAMGVLDKWNKPGRLLQEKLYVSSWINSDEKQRQNVENQVKRAGSSQ